MVALGVVKIFDPVGGYAWSVPTGDSILVLVKKPVWSTIRVLRHDLLLCVVGDIWCKPSSRRSSLTWGIIVEPQVPDLIATFGLGFWMCVSQGQNLVTIEITTETVEEQPQDWGLNFWFDLNENIRILSSPSPPRPAGEDWEYNARICED